jgi:hypothetical protein
MCMVLKIATLLKTENVDFAIHIVNNTLFLQTD